LALADEPSEDCLATTTHARLRAAQGDVRGACRILEAILAARPDDGEARAVLVSLSGATDRAAAEEADETLARPVAADPAALRDRFRDTLGAVGEPPGRRVVRKLERLLRRIEDSRRANRAR